MGACHALAKEIHRLTQWPVVAFSYRGGRIDEHAFVALPNGMYLDVFGVQTRDQMINRWAFTGTIQDIVPVNVDELITHWGYGEVNEKAALKRVVVIAPLLIKQVIY